MYGNGSLSPVGAPSEWIAAVSSTAFRGESNISPRQSPAPGPPATPMSTLGGRQSPHTGISVAKCSWCANAVLDPAETLCERCRGPDAAEVQASEQLRAHSPAPAAAARTQLPRHREARRGARSSLSGNSPALKSDRTARATALLDAVRRLPAGCDVAALGELRNVLNCHEALLEEHCVETETEMACGVGGAPASGSWSQPHTTLGLVIADNTVRQVLPGGPAWVAGLREGDILVAVDGREQQSASAEALQTALSRTDAVGDRVHILFTRQGTPSTTTVERASVQRIKSVRDWMEKQAEAATHASQHNDVVGIRLQKELLDGLIEILTEQKMFEGMMAMRINQHIDLDRAHLEASRELASRLETRAHAVGSKDVEIERLRGLLARGAMCQRHHRLRAKTWSKWCSTLPRARRAKKAASVWLNSVLARSWRTLQWAAVERKRMRALAARAVARWRNRALAGALDLWVDQIARLKRLRQLMAKTVLRWKNLVIGRCFSKWYGELLRRRKAARAAKMWTNRCAGRALNTWIGQVVRTRQIAKILKVWAHRHVLPAWNGWQEFLLQRQRMRALAARAVARWRNRALAGALDLWVDQIARLKRLRQLMAKTVLRWKNLVIGRCFSKWYGELLRRRKAARAAKMWIHRLLATAFNSWSARHEALNEACARALRILKRWHNRALARGWEKWMQMHMSFEQAKLLATRALRRWIHALLARCWQKWCHEVQFRRIAARAAARVRYVRLRAGWRTWVESVEWETTEPECATCKNQGSGQVRLMSTCVCLTCGGRWLHKVHDLGDSGSRPHQFFI